MAGDKQKVTGSKDVSQALENSKNWWVTSIQTVCKPTSSLPVLQQPSR